MAITEQRKLYIDCTQSDQKIFLFYYVDFGIATSPSFESPIGKDVTADFTFAIIL
jgi:hypothetical protein